MAIFNECQMSAENEIRKWMHHEGEWEKEEMDICSTFFKERKEGATTPIS